MTDTNDSAVLGPAQIEAKVHFVHPETGNTAVATFGFPPGQPVTSEDIERALRKSSEAVAEHGYVLMGPNSFFNHVIVKEKTGRVGNFALPRSFDYEAFGMTVAEIEQTEDFDEAEDDE